jgi:hypothetical protein
MRQKLLGPIGGAANNTAFIDTPEQFCPPSAIDNVVLIGSESQRPRLGRRPAQALLMSAQMSSGLYPVQAIATIDIASGVSGYTRDNCTQALDYQSRASDAISGQVWLLEPNTAMYGEFKDVATQTTGDSHFGTYCVQWDREQTFAGDGDRWIVFAGLARKASSGTPFYTCLYSYNVTDGALNWRCFLDDRDTPSGTPGTVSIVMNSIRRRNQRLFVAAGAYVYVVNSVTGVMIGRANCGGWADEVMDVIPVGSKLWVLFMGASAVTGDVTTNTHREGWFYRSGFCRYSVGTDGALTIDQLTLGGENNHGTFRFSSILSRRPRGCIPFAFGMLSGGDLVFAFTNRGWNADGTLGPDSTQAATTLARITQEGVLVWERDTYSRLDLHTVGGVDYYSDIPAGIPGNATPTGSYGAGGPEASLNALVIDAQDNIYVAGRVVPTTLGDRNVFSFDASGNLRWSASVGDFVHQHCLRIDPTDGHLWVAGKRNNSWDGATGNAHGWKLSSSSGSILNHFDLNTASKNVYGIDVNDAGQVIYCTENI